MCCKPSRKAIEPDKLNSSALEVSNPFPKENLESEVPRPIPKPYKSSIVTGSKQPISYNPSIGYINTSSTNPAMDKNSDTEIFYDRAGHTEKVNKDNLIQNLDEAYKIIQDTEENGLFNNSLSGNDHKFTKVIKNINFKDILSDKNEDQSLYI
jgi:hypothetical protein